MLDYKSYKIGDKVKIKLDAYQCDFRGELLPSLLSLADTVVTLIKSPNIIDGTRVLCAEGEPHYYIHPSMISYATVAQSEPIKHDPWESLRFE